MQLPGPVLRDLAALLPDVSKYGPIGSVKATPWMGITDPILRKTAAAAISIQVELNRQGEIGTLLLQNATYGFIAADASLLAQLRAGAPVAGEFTFGAAVIGGKGKQEGEQRLLQWVSAGGIAFPVIEITGNVHLHGIPPHPNHVQNAGSSACWATARQKSSSWTHSILTAAHVVNGVHIGSRIQLVASTEHQFPTVSALRAVAPTTIDAALLEVQPPRHALALLNVLDPQMQPIAPGLQMHLRGIHTNVKGTVIRAHQNPGYFGPMTPERIVIDVVGIPGDSGGLIANHRDGLGIYMGSIPSTTLGARDGVAQGLWQAAQWFHVDMFI